MEIILWHFEKYLHNFYYKRIWRISHTLFLQKEDSQCWVAEFYLHYQYKHENIVEWKYYFCMFTSTEQFHCLNPEAKNLSMLKWLEHLQNIIVEVRL
jgi:hypothetical protein